MYIHTGLARDERRIDTHRGCGAPPARRRGDGVEATARLASCSIPARPGLDHWHRTATTTGTLATAGRHFTRARVPDGDLSCSLCCIKQLPKTRIRSSAFGSTAPQVSSVIFGLVRAATAVKNAQPARETAANSTAVENSICTHDRAHNAVSTAPSSRHHRVAPHPKTIAAEHQQRRR